jgi:hypothetical protein
MSPAALIFFGYLAVGLGLATFVSLKANKNQSVPIPPEEPAIFWVYLLLWPVMALLWLASDTRQK